MLINNRDHGMVRGPYVFVVTRRLQSQLSNWGRKRLFLPMTSYILTVLTAVWAFVLVTGCPSVVNKKGFSVNDDFGQMLSDLKKTFPKHFLEDAVIAKSNQIDRPMVFGEPNPPEGFAGPDQSDKHSFGIYVPANSDGYFKEDISMEQWVFHEMFHLYNRRTKEYQPFIDKAFPNENDALVQWIRKDPYHRTFAREEAFINLITFADPAKTESQKEAVREWFDYVGAERKSLQEIRSILNVIKHW